ncbi:unnamed protein product [Colias eurytheme]|nr:unnamed protein product [Colias eurytheme]CAG4946130.1 unnamed protein product [Colias eurytheme]
MECALCNSTFKEGVQCCICNKHFDFGCAQITEQGWRKLGVERRAAWRCTNCKNSSNINQPPASDTISLESIMKELRDVKNKLTGMPSLLNGLNELKKELCEIKSSCEFLGGKIDDFANKISTMDARLVELESLDHKISSLDQEVSCLKAQLAANDTRSRLNNVEIKGVPIKKNENLYSVVDNICQKVSFSIKKEHINYLYRVPSQKTKDKPIIISFLNRYVKEDFVAAARASKELLARDIGYGDSNNRIFVNDHLSPEMKNLLNSCKLTAKDKHYDYVWVKFGKIHVRKNNSSPVIIITKKSDLNKLS